MRQTFNLNFYCRKSKAGRDQKAPVEMSIIINGKRNYIKLHRKEDPEEFKKSLQTTKSNSIKDFIEEVRNQVNIIQLDMMRNGIPFTAHNLKQYFASGGVKTYTVGNMVDEYLDLLKGRVGRSLTDGAYKKYKEAYKRLTEFVGTETEVATLVPATFEKFLINLQKKYEDSTTAGIMTKVKTLVKYALENGKIRTNPMYGIKYSKGVKDIEFLTQEELDKLTYMEIENKSLANVRDCFVVQASTGLAYIDLLNLQKEDIKVSDEGICYIQKGRHKTGVTFTTVILPRGIEVLKKYDYHLRVLTNQKYNAYLKVLQQMAGISTNLTTHLARKTFATLSLQKGVRMEVVSKMLGHASLKQTESRYAKVLTGTVLNEARCILNEG